MLNSVNYIHKLRLSEALYGTKFVLSRNTKNLEVKLPPRLVDGTRVKLANALSTTDGIPGDIIIVTKVQTPQAIDSAKGANIDDIFQWCLYIIGGINNDHIQNYLSSKNNLISRQLFFEKAVPAIWVAGWGQKQVDTFLTDAVKDGFDWNYVIFGQWSDSQLTQFMQLRHAGFVPERAEKKWKAVRTLAQWLISFLDDDDFRKKVFGGKRQGVSLNKVDVANLRSLNKPFIGRANSNYIIRLLGGEEIKDDKWIREFRDWAGLSLGTLENLLANHEIPRGFFDIVMWEYCNMFIGVVSNLKPSFQSQFGLFLNV